MKQKLEEVRLCVDTNIFKCFNRIAIHTLSIKGSIKSACAKAISEIL